jgi:predicted RNA-binding Zn ribbon-like protein
MRTLHSGGGEHDEVAIARAVALVDVVHEASADVDAAVIGAVLHAHGEQDVALTSREAGQIAAVCGRLRAVLATTSRDDAARGLNALLAEFAGPPRLVRHEGWDWHLHVDRGDDAPWAAWLASSAALALATRLAASDGVPWGECGAGCGRVFVHDGRGGERRYCSATCATRERVRRHRAIRRRRPGEPAPDGASATA